MAKRVTRLSTQEVLNQHVIPLLKELGYTEADFQRHVPLTARREGLLVQDAFALLVRVNGRPRIVADVIEEATPRTAERRLLLAGLLEGGAPPYALITDGVSTFFFETATREQRSRLPSRDEEALALSREEQARIEQRAQETELVEEFIQVLNDCRELIHAKGHYGSRNESIDEVVKLLFIHMHEERNNDGRSRFSREGLRAYAGERYGDGSRVVEALQGLFQEVITEPRYRDTNGQSIFGPDPRLRLDDPGFALDIVGRLSRVRTITDYDLLNTAFGHFLRDNFYSEKELGQYLTPQEVVNAMVELAFADITDGEILDTGFTVYDPGCGAGSFLISAMRHIRRRIEAAPFSQAERARLQERLNTEMVFGQDKTDTMVRLAKINMVMYGDGHSNIVRGNSISDDTAWNRRQHALIFTNPPFGAEFTEPEELQRYETAYTGQSRARKLRRKQNSEVLFIEQCLKQLKPKGRLVIVVPDGILTNTNMAYVREFIRGQAILKAVLSFPTVTFQPAGTGTKTSALYVQKQNATGTLPQSRIFMAVANDIGYQYKSKKVVYGGSNELVRIVEGYRETKGRYGG